MFWVCLHITTLRLSLRIGILGSVPLTCGPVAHLSSFTACLVEPVGTSEGGESGA
jgi:hypothetical protein